MERFGKASAPLLDARGHLLTLEGNDPVVARTRELYACYRRQPRRVTCKVCGTPIGGSPIAEKFGIPYYSCAGCGHLNGGFEDTPAFNAFLFTGEGSGATVAHYGEASRENFHRRVDEIYAPKVRFLFDVLTEAGEEPARLRHVDLGAGTGHFLAGLREAGVPEPVGYDVSPEQVDLGNQLLGSPMLRLHAMDDLDEIACRVEAEVASMIFTLEHLERPRDVMAALSRNPHLHYLFVAVPTVSPAMMLELVFPTVFERQMSTHTHLFSDQSLQRLAKEAGFSRIGEWWFGSDAMDLFRSVAVRLRQTGQSEAGLDLWTEMMRPLIDDWQMAVDRRKWASAVHLVLRKEASSR